MTRFEYARKATETGLTDLRKISGQLSLQRRGIFSKKPSFVKKIFKKVTREDVNRRLSVRPSSR